ncbi:MAG: DNA gyrase inhibitor YacG [Polyangiaceae bacterium]|nr:DNA gyrase inhibitor YacG [Polyangiaceae bacterium]
MEVKIKCPLCSQVIANAADDFRPRPFCSARCKLEDLNNWLTGAYRISEPFDADSMGEDPETLVH